MFVRYWYPLGATVQKTVEIPVVDVPVIFIDKFQQSGKFDLIVPQIQFIFRVWDTPVVQHRTLTFQFPEVACMITLILVFHALPQYRVTSVEKGFFGLLPGSKKSLKFAASPSPRVPARSSSWTPAAYARVQAASANCL